ncbi:unnamed protein product [Oikopleura dioica]|uniref:Phospholipase B-like n=1 Tax=Oikopleura dioica TaxID=34765 RepID=E4X7H0_OIKDI|nr:unnamed protein product [Oikopleura dioica]
MRIFKILLLFNFANAFTLMDPLVDLLVSNIWNKMLLRIVDTGGASTFFTEYLKRNMTSSDIRQVIQNIDVESIRDGGLTIEDFVTIFEVNQEIVDQFDLTYNEGIFIDAFIGKNDNTWNALLEAAEVLQEIYVGEIDAYKFIGIFSDGFDALSSMKNSVNPTIDAVPVTDKILHWTFLLAEKAAFAYEKHEYYYNTMMYYVGMLEYHFENSYIAKVEDFCDAYPEDVDVFGIARDMVFFLQVRILPTINSIDVLTFDAWNHFVENLPVLENYEIPKTWASEGYSIANYYLNGIDGSLEELEIVSNAGLLLTGRTLASYATEAFQNVIC